MKPEPEFVKELEHRAKVQGRLVKTEILPEWARGVGDWLTVNPWRVLVPVSIIFYVVLRFALGATFRELVLVIFGGFE